ncbi:M48 family metalloprotease [Streptomyces sp. NPDC048521]|uniref:M48 family metalloprotease n=1 Tax=Streptomyces sp. NPDC048521 TaxID=3365566 RepID=UPI003713F492
MRPSVVAQPADLVAVLLTGVEDAGERAQGRAPGARGGRAVRVVEQDRPLETPNWWCSTTRPRRRSRCLVARGRIVVCRGMLRCLGAAEREALLAHERAHLRGSHHRFQMATHSGRQPAAATAGPGRWLRPGAMGRRGGRSPNRQPDGRRPRRRSGGSRLCRYAAARHSGRERRSCVPAGAGPAGPAAPAPQPALRGGRPPSRPVLRQPGQRRVGQREPGRERGAGPVRGGCRGAGRRVGGAPSAAAGRLLPPRRSRRPRKAPQVGA